jgi:hypothetical protein
MASLSCPFSISEAGINSLAHCHRHQNHGRPRGIPLEGHATKSLKGSAAQPFASQVLQTPLAQVALELERPAVALHLVPQAKVFAESLLLEPDLLAYSLFLLFQLAVVRLDFLGQTGCQSREGGVGFTAGNDGWHCVQQALGERWP